MSDEKKGITFTWYPEKGALDYEREPVLKKAYFEDLLSAVRHFLGVATPEQLKTELTLCCKPGDEIMSALAKKRSGDGRINMLSDEQIVMKFTIKIESFPIAQARK